jgi:hypothetical protein
VAAAFARGSLSYSKVRAITRIVDADEETDEWLLRVAESGTAADLERVARHHHNLKDQERSVDDYMRRFDRRHLAVSSTHDGMMVMELVVPFEEGQELLVHLRTGTAQLVGERSAERPSPGQERVDALIELLRTAGATPTASTSGGDRYTLHLVADVDAVTARFAGRAELLDGTPIGRETLRRLACDCGVVRHLLRGRSQPLDIGTRTRVWTTAQRRAVTVRDQGRCRFAGCHRRTCDIHHLVHFENGGPTAVHNGLLLCPQHHTCVHEGGFTITGDPGGTLTFYRPDGTVVGTTG